MHTVFIVDPRTDEAHTLSRLIVPQAVQVRTSTRLEEAQHVLHRESVACRVVCNAGINRQGLCVEQADLEHGTIAEKAT